MIRGALFIVFFRFGDFSFVVVVLYIVICYCSRLLLLMMMLFYSYMLVDGRKASFDIRVRGKASCGLHPLDTPPSLGLSLSYGLLLYHPPIRTRYRQYFMHRPLLVNEPITSRRPAPPARRA